MCQNRSVEAQSYRLVQTEDRNLCCLNCYAYIDRQACESSPQFMRTITTSTVQGNFMKPYSRTVIALFDGKRRYVIPLFQRQYVWQEEKQLKPLWEDIISKAEARLDGKEPRPHFLGAIVLDQLKTYGDQALAHVVIDGQQRLTTFQIFLAALRDFAKANDIQKYYEEISSYTYNKGIMQDPEVEKFKVWPTQTDQPQFRICLDSHDCSVVANALKITHDKAKTGIEPHMIVAYAFFYKALENYRNDPELSQYSVTDKVEALFRSLSRDLEIVSIELEGDDDPQVIFETLNARGEPLLASDLLRNYIFFKAAHNKENAADLYDKYWLRFDQAFWKTEEKQGRLKRSRIDLFFHHLLQANTGDEVNIARLYSDYKAWNNTSKRFESAEEELAYLSHYADWFEKLIRADGSNTLGQFSILLNVLDVKTIYPLLLYLTAEAQLPEGESLSDFLADLESYLIRRQICNYTGKNYNKFFLQVLRDLRKEGPSRAQLQKSLNSGTGEPTAWPDDNQFRLAWMTKNAYAHARGGKLAMILTKLESSLRTSKSENMPIPKNVTIEHVMPQSWETHWPLKDGRTVPDALERLLRDIKEPEADRRDSLIHTMGNLTMLTSSLNPSVSNSGYAIKREEVLNHSELALNRYFYKVPVWDEDAIEIRAKLLFDKALSIWPYPSINDRA